LTLLVIILIAIFTAEISPTPPPEVRASAAREPLLTPPPAPPPAPSVERKEPPPVSEPAAVAAPPEEEKRPDPARAAAEALSAFRASLPGPKDSELMGEIPWGTWARDLHHAPGGEARFEPSGRNCVLTARRDGDRVWIKREFAGVKAGYQVRFRLGPGTPRFALALSFSRWIEIREGIASLFRVAADESLQLAEQATVDATTARTLTVVPTSPNLLIFLEDRLLFTVPAAEWAGVEGLQLGASGGTVYVESVRVKDRTR
jgi:hypothetical protein